VTRDTPKNVPVYCLSEEGMLEEIGSSGDSDSYELPKRATTKPPPKDIEEGKIALFNFDKKKWEIVPKDPYERLSPKEKLEVDKQREIADLESFLKRSDYIGNKIIEGESTIEDYADLIQERKEARRRLRELNNG